MKRRSEIITFKVDAALLEAMRGISNRSDFIRSAVITALDSGCPLCHGTGVLTTKQREHWNRFQETHAFEECDDCHEEYLVCQNQTRRSTRRKRTG